MWSSTLVSHPISSFSHKMINVRGMAVPSAQYMVSLKSKELRALTFSIYMRFGYSIFHYEPPSAKMSVTIVKNRSYTLIKGLGKVSDRRHQAHFLGLNTRLTGEDSI